MLFHQRDNTGKTIKGCWKRAVLFGKRSETIDTNHPLYVCWENCKLFIDAREDDSVEAFLYDSTLLDWFALQVDEHLKENMISGDTTLGHFLFEWKLRMHFDPTKLVA